MKAFETGCVCGPGIYQDGPTACAAHPDVMADIESAIAANHVLSAADARLAARAGMLAIPEIERSGFNDGLFYPPEEPLPANLAAPAPQPSAMFANRQHTGTLHCLVLLVDFSDNQGTTPASHYESLLFDRTNPNSLRSFYSDLSYGALDVDGTVVGWLRAQHPYAYYADGASGTGASFPRNTPGLLEEILRQYTRTNSLAPFDRNGDGYLDGLFLVHAGGGAEAEANRAARANMIWSHKWTLPNAFANSGVRAYAYFTAPEDGKLGVFSHEFGHFLGLPDLYDTSYRSHGVGNWCLMGGGSWNGGGQKPARMSAWCLSTLGWIAPRNLTIPERVSLPALEVDPNACIRAWTAGDVGSEYFLLENRQQTGRDSALPGHGLAVWHIDETQANNTNPLAYRVALVQADGRRHLEFKRNAGDADDLFPGPAGVIEVDDVGGHPHTRANDGSSTKVRFSAIAEVNGVVDVNVSF